MALYGSDTTIPYQPRREPYYNGQMAPSSFESGIDIGDYVARRIVPVMLGRSDRPLQLVMNLGHLELEEPPQVRGSSRRNSSLGSTSNAIIYNAPGSTMSITGGLRRRTRSEYNGYQVVNTPDDLRLGPIANRRIGTCLQCCRRLLIAPSGYCTECETSYGGRGPLTLVARSGMDRRGWDGVRYIGGSSPMRRTSDQWERDRNRDSLLPGYYTDSDIGWRRS